MLFMVCVNEDAHMNKRLRHNDSYYENAFVRIRSGDHLSSR